MDNDILRYSIKAVESESIRHGLDRSTSNSSAHIVKDILHKQVTTLHTNQSSIIELMVSKLAYPKMITRKFSLTALAAATILMTSNLAALGLGALEVKSNLDQPLDGTIELRVASGDDLGSVTAAIASREDFEQLGIDYPSYLGNMSLSVERMGGDTYVLRVVSNDVVIKEPFIHFLVRVDYSGGSFLREYTALIDPPVYASEAPTSIAEPRAVGVDQSYQIEPQNDVKAQEIEPEIEEYSEPAVEAEVVDEVFTEQEPQDFQDSEPFDQNQETLGTLPSDARYGPVATGESLSVIAQELQRQFPDLSIYQIMQVLFEENRGAFVNENINGLMKGAVLNIGDLNAIRQVDIAAAKQFFYDQVNEWDPSAFASNDIDDGLRVGQDEYSYDDSIVGSQSTNTGSTDSYSSGDDAFQVGASSETNAQVSGGEGSSNRGEVLALQQQISDLETSLASSSLENQELTERISLLEGQLVDMNRLISLDVESADLAAIESTLADQNSSEELQDDSSDLSVNDDLAVGDSEVLDTLTDTEIVDDELVTESDDGFIDPLAGLEDLDSDGSEISAIEENIDDDIDTLVDLDDSSIESDVEPIVSTPQPATVSSSSSNASFMDKVKSAIFGSGLWKIIAGAGALLLAGLGLWFARRRRADEEFEISMMSIESQSNSASQERAVSVPSDDDKSKSVDRETSFLTVYSDSDAVVQADEVDPVAEADVYIAYGRDEQAEEVLLDGIASNPARVDIKQKLLSLYHKNNNVEGFERIAEELYSQKNFLTKNVWQEVSLMGKDLAPENPLFDVSSSDLLTEGPASDNMITSGDVVEPEVDVDEPAVDTTVDEYSDSESVEVIQEAASDVDEIKFAEENPSINLINFDDEVSEIDDVNLDDIDLSEDTDIDPMPNEAVEDVIEISDKEDGVLELDAGDDSGDLEGDSVFEIDFSDDANDSSAVTEGVTQAEDDASDFTEADHSKDVSEVSDLELDDDYDEARTQYELAKVFVDLGDEDGARKILDDIVANEENSKEVLEDSNKLLQSIND